MRIKLIYLFFLFLVTQIAGCASAGVVTATGKEYELKNSYKIQVGMTKANIIALLGSPLYEQINLDGERLIGYQFVTTKVSSKAVGLIVMYSWASANKIGQEIKIYFDEHDNCIKINRMTYSDTIDDLKQVEANES